MAATPITQELATELASLMVHDACGCGDDCKEDGRCPGPCQTCFCCPHANAIALAPFTVPEHTAQREPLQLQREQHDSEAHVPAPFRPPMV